MVWFEAWLVHQSLAYLWDWVSLGRCLCWTRLPSASYAVLTQRVSHQGATAWWIPSYLDSGRAPLTTRETWQWRFVTVGRLDVLVDSEYSDGVRSIPINTIFSGMNIHVPAILMFTRGTRFWHTARYSFTKSQKHSSTSLSDYCTILYLCLSQLPGGYPLVI